MIPSLGHALQVIISLSTGEAGAHRSEVTCFGSYAQLQSGRASIHTQVHLGLIFWNIIVKMQSELMSQLNGWKFVILELGDRIVCGGLGCRKHVKFMNLFIHPTDIY